MKVQFTNQKKLIIGASALLVVIIGIYSMVTQKKLVTPPANTTTNPSFNSVDRAPTIVTTQGAGVNIESPEVQSSIDELSVLTAALPYQKSLTVNGTDLEITIPQIDSQAHSWILIVYIDPIDFQAPIGTSEYTTNKDLFLQAAVHINDWMKGKGINPTKVIIKWGDRAFMQTRAEEWLAQP